MAYLIRLVLAAMLLCGNSVIIPSRVWAAGGMSPREARNEILDQEAQGLMSEFALLRRWAEEDCARCDEEAQKRCAGQIARMEELANEARSLARNYSAQKDAMEQNARDILKMLEKFANDIGAAEIAQMAGKAASEIALGAMVGNVPGLLIGIGVAIADIAVEIRNRGIAAREKQHIIDAAERQGKEIKKAGELIQQFDQLAKDMESDIAALKIKRKNCKKPVPPETGGTIIDKGAEVSKVKIKDASTGKPLDGDTIVIPNDPDGTTTKGPDNTYVPKEGDTIIFSAPCHEKKKVWIGREPIPGDVGLNPRPLRFVINCDDSAAIDNIRKALNEQGVTFAPECMKRQKEWVRGSGPAAPNYCKEIVSIDCYTIQRGPAPGEQPTKLKCPDDIVVPAGPGPDPSQPGNFEPDYWREGQAKAKSEPSADPFYNSSGTWGQCYEDQWGLKRVGFSSAAAKDSLWPEYAEPVTVAVIDTGVDMLHPDLLGAVWVNTKEIPGNNIDDDKNGYVDDIHGWNFVDKNNDTSDNNGHGTIVAGIIAAWNGNGIGISGVNPWARIMPVKATDFNNKGWSIDLARAIRYAVDNGARVINASIGGETPSEAEKLALDYAQQKGVLVVVAAGNKGINTKDFSPASFDNVITVASTDVNDKRVNFSNWGRSVDIAAPGTDILSLHAAGTDYLVFERDDYKGGFALVGDDKRYYRTSGSSFSAPFVSGTASLILSEKPNLTAEQVRRMVIYSAKDIDVPGRDQYTGYGLLDAKAALSAEPDYFLEARIDGIKLNQVTGNALFEVRGTADADQLKAAWLEIGQGEAPAKWKAVGEKLQGPVKEGLLGSFGLEAVKGANTWAVRLIVEHKNGKKQEARYVLNLQEGR